MGVSNVHLVVTIDPSGKVCVCVCGRSSRSFLSHFHPLHRTAAILAHAARVWLQLMAGKMSEVNATLLNGTPMPAGAYITHGDVFDICGRKFRYENVSDQATPRPPPYSAALGTFVS
jgi:pSer/pThr/pTyr-binding forkhead associated (FHA) protein